MRFSVRPSHRQPRASREAPGFYLVTNDWDDWFTYNTQYELVSLGADGQRVSVGQVKIGQFGMGEGQRRPDLPGEFEELDERFFSLGQDISYYEDLAKLGHDVREQVLRSLRDVALDQDLFRRALAEDVT